MTRILVSIPFFEKMPKVYSLLTEICKTEEWGTDCLMGIGFSWLVFKMFWNQIEGMNAQYSESTK